MSEPSDPYVVERNEKIRDLINEIHAYMYPEDGGSVLTDALMVYARKAWTDKGVSKSNVVVAALDPYMPDYISVGLLSHGLDIIAALPDDESDEGDDNA